MPKADRDNHFYYLSHPRSKFLFDRGEINNLDQIPQINLESVFMCGSEINETELPTNLDFVAGVLIQKNARFYIGERQMVGYLLFMMTLSLAEIQSIEENLDYETFKPERISRCQKFLNQIMVENIRQYESDLRPGNRKGEVLRAINRTKNTTWIVNKSNLLMTNEAYFGSLVQTTKNISR